MPLYEYQCQPCGHRFEVLQRMGAGNDGLCCPRCSAPEPSRRLSTFAARNGGSAVSGAATDAGGCGAPGCGTGFT